jgi:hypothetical protein
MRTTGKWLGPLSGILFAGAVVVAGGIFGGTDREPSDSASAVLAEFREKADDIGISALVTMLGIGFLLIFVAHMRTKFRDAGAGSAADGFLAGGIALAGAFIAVTGVQLAGRVAGENGHAEVAQGANDFLWESVFLFTPGLLVLGITAAIVSFSSRVLPTWLGVFALLVAVGALAPWMGIFVLIAWVLAASIVELIQKSGPTPN